MIHSKEEACSILGIGVNAGQSEWKSAYRSICKQYHPDSVGSYAGNRTCDFYYQAVEAYEYLEMMYQKMLSQKAVQKVVLQPETSVKSGGKIIGGPVTYRKKQDEQKRMRKQMEVSRQQKYEEMQKAAEDLKQKEKEKRILDEIRWIRVADIIKKAMAEDQREKENRKRVEEALRKWTAKEE